MQPTPLSAQMVGLTQAEPTEGRKAIPLTAVTFVTGAELFGFNSGNLAPAPPTSIVSMWVDATLIAPAVSVIINTGLQNIVVQGGTQKYIILTCQNPLAATISLSGVGAGNVPIILYNYNVEFTGVFTTKPADAPRGAGFKGASVAVPRTPGGHGASI